MSTRRSNRAALIEGALRCLETSSFGEITARDIAAASGANLASIGYHFGSKDALLAHSLAVGFQRWLAEFGQLMASSDAACDETGDETGDEVSPRGTLERAAAAASQALALHRGLALAAIEALVRASRDEQLRAVLASSYAAAREELTRLLGLGEDETGGALAGILLAVFDGLMMQRLLDAQHAKADELLLPALDRLALLLDPAARPALSR